MGQLSTAAAPRWMLTRRFTESAGTLDSPVLPLADFDAWFAGRRAACDTQVDRVPLDRLRDWRTLPGGDLAHVTGRFFSIRGLRVRTDANPDGWSQPIIVQPDIGALGIVVREFDGVLHCLMQAKMEPGNVDGPQLSPTVQATRSNYSGVHRGRAVTYLQLLRPAAGGRVLVDSLQSEQGSWFLRKLNRNIVAEAVDDLPLADNFCWLTVGQIHRLLRRPNVVNMDARTVFSCLPLSAPTDEGDDFRAVLRRSITGPAAYHGLADVTSWLTDVRFRRELVQEVVPLDAVSSWRRTSTDIRHDSGRYFTIIGVDVRASREVTSWSQPLLAPVGQGLAALLVRRIDGVLHLLLQARVEAGTNQVAELAPTVQCCPANYRDVPRDRQPRYLADVQAAAAGSIRYDVVQSEEGGRFHHAQTRNVVVEVGDDFPMDVPPDYCWVTLHQVAALLQHPGYLCVEARTIVGCLRALAY
jgi:oxidase EvaA